MVGVKVGDLMNISNEKIFCFDYSDSKFTQKKQWYL